MCLPVITLAVRQAGAVSLTSGGHYFLYSTERRDAGRSKNGAGQSECYQRFLTVFFAALDAFLRDWKAWFTDPYSVKPVIMVSALLVRRILMLSFSRSSRVGIVIADQRVVYDCELRLHSREAVDILRRCSHRQFLETSFFLV